MENEICTIEDVASALGRKPDYVRNNWRRLNRDHNFPRPLPGSDYARWSRQAFLAWVASGGRSIEPDGGEDLVARARAAIHAELGVGT